MEVCHRPGVRSGVGILESAVGEGFAAALQAGLSRATVNGLHCGPPTHPAAASGLPSPTADHDRQTPQATPSAEAQAADALWNERRRLAREVHDEVGTPIGLALRRLTLHEAAVGDPSGHLGVVYEALAQAERHIAQLVGGLRTQTEVPLLKDAVLNFAVRAAPADVKLSVRSTGQERDLPDSWRREIFLAVRECLRNSFHHASAGRVSVVSRVTRRWMYVRIEDDGRGFESSSPLPVPHEGHGLRSMAERIEALGGRLAVRSAPAVGTRVEIHVPVRPYP
ncbi:ATP-binding protein [Streptomyces xanthochromogenes]|uniref:sensor histidine kinase n=1 Tax=Streptomyces xanthochromogenes TaxID=67384 RepID=UPI00343FD3B3